MRNIIYECGLETQTYHPHLMPFDIRELLDLRPLHL